MDFQNNLRKYKIEARHKSQKPIRADSPDSRSAITASYKGYTGATLHKGKALSLEIESYRRRIQALVHFLDLIAPHWWDRLHPFNGEFVRRPSRSADLIRCTQKKLSKKLVKLTPRAVLPAAAAIASIEERDTIPVLPKCLYRPSYSRDRNVERCEDNENEHDLVNLALSIARRLGEIEKAKQQIILYVYDWVNSDGRDFNLRNRRITILAKNAQACIIERFRGVRALITHYYRRRARSASLAFDQLQLFDISSDAKFQLQHAFDGVTAIYLNSTNQAILDIIAQADSHLQCEVSTGVGILMDIHSEEMMDIVNRGLPPKHYAGNEAFLLTTTTESQDRSDSTSPTLKNINPPETDFTNIKDLNISSVSPSRSNFGKKNYQLNINSQRMKNKLKTSVEQDGDEYYTDDNEEFMLIDNEIAANMERLPSLLRRRQRVESASPDLDQIQEDVDIEKNNGKNATEERDEVAVCIPKGETLAVIAVSTQKQRSLYNTNGDQVIPQNATNKGRQNPSLSRQRRKSSLLRKSHSGAQDSRLRSQDSSRSLERISMKTSRANLDKKQTALTTLDQTMNSSELIMSDFRKLIHQNRRASVNLRPISHRPLKKSSQ